VISRRVALGLSLALISVPLSGLAPAAAVATPNAVVLPSTVTLTVSPTLLTIRNGIATATVRVTSTSGTPTGEVRFFIDNVESGRAQLVDGVASRQFGPFTKRGTYVMTAGYAGDLVHGAAGSAPVTITVIGRHG
jgi:hypothetical protein